MSCCVVYEATLRSGSRQGIAGDLDYRSDRQIEIPTGTVAGRVQFDQIEREEQQTPFLNGLFDFGSDPTPG